MTTTHTSCPKRIRGLDNFLSLAILSHRDRTVRDEMWLNRAIKKMWYNKTWLNRAIFFFQNTKKTRFLRVLIDIINNIQYNYFTLLMKNQSPSVDNSH